MTKCWICENLDTTVFFKQKNIPLFQNVTYSSYNDAVNVQCSDVFLTRCKRCNFIFNSKYKKSDLDYGENYQNEQANSLLFQNHLLGVYKVIQKHIYSETKTIELGCGKGYFLNFLLDKGIDITGFDPAYEGNNEKIIKDYFSSKYKFDVDFIILRHTLEHIQYPLEFLHQIAKSNNYKGKIYIEVPTFEWIAENNALEDIFYEHCNYFTIETLSMLFSKSEAGYLFGDQYIYLMADLIDLKKGKEIFSLNNTKKQYEIILNQKYLNILKENKNIAVWGAGAKGNTFVNIFDSGKKYVKCIIDINVKKQGKFIAKTGHKIISPKQIEENNIDTIIVMNINYIKEIEREIKKKNIIIKLITL